MNGKEEREEEKKEEEKEGGRERERNIVGRQFSTLKSYFVFGRFFYNAKKLEQK